MDISTARILVATGSHSFSASARNSFTTALLDGITVADVAWHDSESPDLVSIAGSWAGHSWLGLSDAPVLAIGSVEPHYFAGFSGCHKTATIGVASYEDIQANHTGALSPAARGGVLEGNPVHEGIAEMLRALQTKRNIIGVNIAQPMGKIVACHFGDPITALKEIIPAAEKHFLKSLPRPADAIIAEVTGVLGRSFYQADKGIKNTEWAVADGGAIILVAPCDDGIGQDHFMNLLKRCPTHAQALQTVTSQGYALGDHKAVRLRYLTDKACRGVKLYIVSKAMAEANPDPKSLEPILNAQIHSTLESAIKAAGIDPESENVHYIKDAGNVCLTI